ncbi:MAG: translation elongation factor Ts [Clostridia bacterium]|jgi:elongation factor Ts|nr:translation elongation factor Ts [Clostridia bacterium]MCI1999633.1 translation elongation factor Ts [Clostridia bacterium]MCI2013988.1 translation elongation factor Ts [Clostridia bacterium]
MAITAAMVKELREMTGVGMLDCKKALDATDGDMQKAVEFLREKGLAASAKKAGRIAAEGIVCSAIADDKKSGVIVEVNSETDFVAKNPVFREYVSQVANQALASNAAEIDAFLAEKWNIDPSVTVAEALSQKVAVIGENLKIRRFKKLTIDEAGKIISYIHGGGRIGVIIKLACDKDAPEVDELGKNICMQIAALNPKFIADENVPKEFIDHEKEILIKQAKEDPKNASKPTNIIEKMITGRLKKELKEFCLLDQAYVKDGDMNVAQYIASVAKAIGTDIKVEDIARFETGEGLEKKEDDFAKEVAEMSK